MLLLDGVDGPPTTELPTELANAPGAAAAIPGPALDVAEAAMAAVPLIIVEIPAPAVTDIPDGMELAGFIPLELSSIFVCACAVGAIADDRWDSVGGVLMIALAFFFLEDFWPDSEADEIVASSFTPDRVESTGRTDLRSECRDVERESETGCTPLSYA